MKRRMDGGSHMKGNFRNIFWGLCFSIGAVLLVISELGIIGDLEILSIFITAVCGAVMINGIRKINFWEILFPLAIAGWVWDDELHITQITPWTLLMAAVLLSIGLNFLFKNIRKKRHNKIIFEGEIPTNFSNMSKSYKETDGNEVRFENNFGQTTKYINSPAFKYGSFENNFGTMSIYFDNTIIEGGQATIKVENSFGETVIYIPSTWKVDNHISTGFGAVRVKGNSTTTGTPVLQIYGEASFGDVVISYI